MLRIMSRVWLVALALLTLAQNAKADELTRTVQEQLHAQGFYPGPIDGKAGIDFTNALKHYQLRHGLPVTGTIDRATAKALDDENGLALPEAAASRRVEKSPTPQAVVPTVAPTAISEEITSPPAHRAIPTSSVPPPTPPITNSAANAPGAAPTVSATPQSNATPLPVTSPSPREEQLERFSVERVTKFLRDYLHAGEGKYVTPQLRYFSFPVDYFAHGSVNQQFVRSDTLRYMHRWPRRRYMLIEPVKVAPVDDATASAEFTISFTVQRGKRRANGRTTNLVTLRQINGELKIVGIKEQRVPD